MQRTFISCYLYFLDCLKRDLNVITVKINFLPKKTSMNAHHVFWFRDIVSFISCCPSLLDLLRPIWSLGDSWVVVMSTNQTLIPDNEERGKSWRFQDVFSTNMLNETLTESDMIVKLEELFGTRLGHSRPTAVTGCMIIVNRDQFQILHQGVQIMIYGYVQSKVAMRQKCLQKWIPECDWIKLPGGLYNDRDFRTHISNPSWLKIKVYQEITWKNNAGRTAAKVPEPPSPPSFHSNVKIQFLCYK